jgi:hypothetical protein
MRLMQQTPAQGTRTRRVAEPHDVIDVLSDLFILQGIPAYIRSDNGPEFLSAENLRAMSDLIPLAVMVMLPLALLWVVSLLAAPCSVHRAGVVDEHIQL